MLFNKTSFNWLNKVVLYMLFSLLLFCGLFTYFDLINKECSISEFRNRKTKVKYYQSIFRNSSSRKNYILYKYHTDLAHEYLKRHRSCFDSAFYFEEKLSLYFNFHEDIGALNIDNSPLFFD